MHGDLRKHVRSTVQSESHAPAHHSGNRIIQQEGARMQPFSTSLAILTLAFSASAIAQDTRTVTEPVIPPFCTTLDAHLSAINDGTYNTLAPADESKLDTERIQKAIDSCAKGKAVALQAHGATNAFLSGPLE